MDKETFTSGATRDSQKGKLRYDLVPMIALKRLVQVYTRGCETHTDRNWEKGIEFQRMIGSIDRHWNNWKMRGKPAQVTDDDLAQASWGMFGLMWFEEMIKAGKRPAELDDRPEAI